MDIAVLIVNSLAVLAAVVGLIITSVQFKKTMDAQNRAISVSLFELRTEVLASVESGKLDFNRTKAQFLFERSISDKIKEYVFLSRRQQYPLGGKTFLPLGVVISYPHLQEQPSANRKVFCLCQGGALCSQAGRAGTRLNPSP